MFTIDVFFSGLIAFALGDKPQPSGTCTAAANGGDIYVLMLKGDLTDPHTPKFIANVRNVDTANSSGDPDEILSIVTPEGEEEQFAVWDISEYKISLDKVPSIALGNGIRDLNHTFPQTPTSSTPGTDSVQAFSWFPDLQVPCPDPAPNDKKAAKHSCIDDPPKCGLVSAQAKLSYTSSSTSYLAPAWDKDSLEAVYSNDDSFKQAVPDRGQLHLELSGVDHLDVILDPYDHKKPKRSISLTAPKINPTAPVQAWFSNNPSHFPPKPDPKDAIPHFHLFYDLLDHPIDNCKKELHLQKANVQPVKCAVCTTCDGQ